MKSAFTLIELLVVVTIIIVLLAMLTPALDRAVYQAKLASCGAGNMKVTANAVNIYASEYKRVYPYRSAVKEGGAFPIDYQIQFVRAPFSSDPRNGGSMPAPGEYGTSGGADDRPELMPYMPLKALMDPLCGQVEISPESTFTASWIGVDYSLSFGYQYRTPGSEGMLKLGKKLVWPNNNDVSSGSAASKLYVYRQLLGDVVIDERANNRVSTSHPNQNGTVSIRPRQNVDWGVPGSPVKATACDNYGWPGGYGVPLYDFNFAFPDGSVHRFTDVPRPPSHNNPALQDPDLNPDNPNPEYPLLPAPRTMLAAPVTNGAIWLAR